MHWLCRLVPTCSLVLASAGMADAAVPPSAGTYTFALNILSQTPTPSSALCSDAQNYEYLGAYFYYTGPNAAGSTIRQGVFANSSYTDSAVMKSTLPKTPGAGVTAWSGVETFTLPGSPAIKVPFSWTFSFDDASSFDVILSQQIPVSGGICIVNSQGAAIRILP